MAIDQNSLFTALRRMRKAGNDFYFDGESTAVRLVSLTPALEEHLATAFREMLAKYRGNAMQTGLLLVWEGFVSPSHSDDGNRFYAVVTFESWCPKTREDFDREILGFV